ncbi:MAG: DUF808 domain-containing protein [Betaproteobacteria bacterium]|nr:MAG: DUF808 domain-containing protein [Betaproteobacteria bacterium]
MASSFFALFDDIATILDDVAVLSKVAAKKTAGVLGDDLALNAEQVAGVKADRELPVVWAVAKGSFINKLILVPAALALATFVPWTITPLLMLGGAFLCYEGFEKLAHKFLHSKADEAAHHKAELEALSNPAIDMVQFEKDKIKGAIRTDFILSAEIIVITLGTVANQVFSKQLAVLSVVAIAMTIGVYGLVAGIVKLDDVGLRLTQRASSLAQALGRGLLWFAPFLMKTLSILGTAAMFLVGGSIVLHGLGPIAHAVEAMLAGIGSGVITFVLSTIADLVVGIIVGALVLLLVTGAKKLFGGKHG